MIAIQRRFSAVGLLLLVCAQSAFGGQYADPSGFSLSYPDGWIAVTRANLADLTSSVPPDIKNWISKNRLRLDQMTVALVRDGRDDFLENINVVVLEQQIPLDDATVNKMAGMMTQKYGAMGLKAEGLKARVDRFGSRDALVVEFTSQVPGVPMRLRQEQVMFPGGGKTYIVTCTAKADTFDQYKPTFDGVLASFQAPAPRSLSFDWNRVFTKAWVGGITGVLIAGLVGIARKLSGSKSSAR